MQSYPSYTQLLHCVIHVTSGVRTALCVVASKDLGSLKRFKRTRLGAPDCLTATLPALMQSHHPRHASAAASGQCRNFSSFLIIAGATEQLGRVHLCNYNREHVTVVSGQQGWVG